MTPPKPRNPVARALRAPTFSKKVVRNRKDYTWNDRIQSIPTTTTPRAPRPSGPAGRARHAALLGGPPG